MNRSETTTEERHDGNRALKALLWTGAAVGAAALANALIFYRTPPLANRLSEGETHYFPTPEGDIFYRKAGDGPPLLLIHGIGAGCSSYEWRHVFGALAEKHTVYALDLLGFGKSDKPRVAYSADLYLDLIDDFCRQVIGVGDGRGEADVVATSLSAAYVIALSQRDPSIFRRLVLVCPTGIESLVTLPGASDGIARETLRAPVVGTGIYNLIASKLALRQYLASRIYAQGARVTDAVVEQYHVAAHQPGADNVLPYFVGGHLNIDIARKFPGVVDLPLIVWGRQAKETPLEQATAFLTANRHAKLEVIEDAGMLPHDEQPEAFLAAVRPFLAGAPEEVAEAEPEVEAAQASMPATRARKRS